MVGGRTNKQRQTVDKPKSQKGKQPLPQLGDHNARPNPLSTIGIKHGFSCIIIRQVPREVLKTEAGGLSCATLFHLFTDVSRTQFARTHLVTAANMWPGTIILKVA